MECGRERDGFERKPQAVMTVNASGSMGYAVHKKIRQSGEPISDTRSLQIEAVSIVGYGSLQPLLGTLLDVPVVSLNRWQVGHERSDCRFRPHLIVLSYA